MAISNALRDRLDAAMGAVKARSAEITEQVEAKRKEIAQQSAKMREENEKLSKELDKKVEERKAAKDDPNSNNAWAKRERPQDSALSFGNVEDDDFEEPAAPPPPRPEPPKPTPAPKPIGRHAKSDDYDDDDDFGTQSWLR